MESLYLNLEDEHHEALKKLRDRSNTQGLLRLAIHLGLLIVLGAVVASVVNTVWYWPAAFVYGVVLTFFFAPLHECLHNTVFKSRWLNDWVGKVIGIVLILPRNYFRCFHFAHHRHTQLAGKDPELAVPKPVTLIAYLRFVSGAGYWTEQIPLTLRHAMGRVSAPFISNEARPGVVKEAQVAVLIYVGVIAISIATGSMVGLVYWIIPMLLGQPMLRLFLLAEHTGCEEVADMLHNSRTIYTNPLVRLISWNMSFHTAHHVSPAIPFHQLAHATRTIAGRCLVADDGYTRVHAKIVSMLRRSNSPELNV